MNPQSGHSETLDLRAYLKPIWRRKWVVVLVAVIAAAGAYAYSATRPKAYTTSTHVYVENADPTAVLTPGAASSGPPTPQQLQDIATLFTAQSVTSAVSRKLGMPVGEAGSVSIVPDANSSFITVTATSHSPALAARLANAYVKVFLANQRQQIVQQAHQAQVAAQSQLATLHQKASDANATAERQTLLSQISELQSIQLDPAPSARQIDTAIPPSAPSSPHPVRDGLIGLAIGLVIGMLLAYLLEMFDNRILSVEAIDEVFSKPVLALLPHVKNPSPAVDGRSVLPREFVEPVRMVRLQLDMAGEPAHSSRHNGNGTAEGGKGRMIVVTSGQPGEGKSTTARGLALAYAESGLRVLLIDADLRRPSLDRLLNSPSEAGLVHVVAGEVALSDAVRPVAIPEPTSLLRSSADVASSPGSLDLLNHGAEVADPVTFTSSSRMRDLVESTRSVYDVIVVDTPPILAVGDAVPLLQGADLGLVVIRLGQTTLGSASATNELLRRLPDIELAGVIVNDLRRSGGSGYGGYGYGGYGYGGYEGSSARQRAEEVQARTPA
ncbi:MAG TPA: AAA family ATPase [Pseudonocardiaceae bacterium]|nr:AAA family ATPase [Pseudonocardiaceae bacterium]